MNVITFCRLEIYDYGLGVSRFLIDSFLVLLFGNDFSFSLLHHLGGKSAVLTGIVVGLGGRASNTNRGLSVKTFIKKGATQAKITIKVANYNGNRRQSFKYAKYGAEITVERYVRPTHSSYAMKDIYGKVVSAKKEELNDMVRHFSMQIDNPVCILNQEISRNFLNSKNPKDKYTFFMRATQLEQITAEYVMAREKYEYSRQVFEDKKESLPGLEKELKSYKRRVDLLESCSGLKTKLDTMKKELVWKVVEEKEEQLVEVEKSVDIIMNKLATATNAIEKQKDSIKSNQTEKNQIAQDISTLVARFNSVMEEINKVNTDSIENDDAIRTKRDAMRMQKHRISELDKEIEQLQVAIKEQEKQNQ